MEELRKCSIKINSQTTMGVIFHQDGGQTVIKRNRRGVKTFNLCAQAAWTVEDLKKIYGESIQFENI